MSLQDSALSPRRMVLVGMGWFPDQPGGLNRYFSCLYRFLRPQIESCQAVVIGPVTAAPDDVSVAGATSEAIPLRLLRHARRSIQLARKADVLDVHFALYGLAPAIARSSTRTAMVVHFHGPWAEESAVGNNAPFAATMVKRVIERTVYHRADQFVVLSGAFKRTLVESYFVPPWKIHVVPPGVDLERFFPGDTAEARAALGIDCRAWVAVAARRLVPRMGLDVLLQAWADLGGRIPNSLLLIVGEGPMRTSLEEQARRLGLRSRVRFLGRVSDTDLRTCYQAANISIVPSLALEGFGLVVVEALACGTPVVATDVGGLPEALAELDPSLIIPTGDPETLANRLEEGYNGRRPLPTRQECRRHAESFSWEYAVERTLQVYRQAAGSSIRRRVRVVVLDHCARLSGGELSLLDLLPALPDIEFHVIVGEDGPLVSKLTQIGISVEVLPISASAGDLRRGQVRPGALPILPILDTTTYSIRLSRHLRRLRPDLVHTNSLKAALYGGATARLLGIPVIWHIRDRIAEDYLPRVAVRLVRKVAQHVPTHVLANSRTTLATLPGVRGTIVPGPVAVSKDNSVPAPINHGPLRCGIIGRLASWKGQDVFLKAFASAFQGGKEQAVVIGSAVFSGDEAYAASLPSLASRLNIASQTSFRGFCEDVASELRKLDVLVHASVVPEPFGRVVIEGMAAGLAVVATGQGGPAEVIDHGVNGMLTPPGDVHALALTLQQLAVNTDHRHELGQAARHRARDFTPQRIAPRVMEVYRDIVR
jgi:glycosyltransferase involved in cell wall biosynthesis